MSVARAFEPSQREDARAIAVFLYSSKDQLNGNLPRTSRPTGLLKNEAAIGIVSSCLPALKIVLEIENDDDAERYGRVVHGLLSTCLQNVDAMRSVFV